MPATYPFSSSKLKEQYHVTTEDVAIVDVILQKKYPIEAKPLQMLVYNEVSYRIEDDLVHPADKAEAVAKTVIALQTPVPMEGMPKGSFPNKVEREYVRKVHSFFEDQGGKSWLKSKFEPTDYVVPEPRGYGTMSEKVEPNGFRADRNNTGDGNTQVLVGIIGLIVVFVVLFSSALLLQGE